MAEVLHRNLSKIEASDIHSWLGLEKGRYILLSAHREESSFFSSVGRAFPAVCIRTSTERPEALDKGCFLLVGIDTDSLLQAVEMAVAMKKDALRCTTIPDYQEENVSMKVARIIQSYTGIVDCQV